MRKLIIVIMLYSCNSQPRNTTCTYEVTSMKNPMNGMCEYKLWSPGCHRNGNTTIVDSIGKYKIGQYITIN